MQQPHKRARSSPEIVFFPRWVWHPIPLSILVKDLGVQTVNMFSPSDRWAEAANKARRLVRCSFQDLSNRAFIPLYGALMRPHLEYGMPACSPNLVADINYLERIQRLATRLVIGIRHLPYEERLQRRRLLADLITAFKIFKGLLDIDPNLFFLPPARHGLRGHPYKVFQGASHRRRRSSAFSVRVVKYCNKLPASVATAPSVNVLSMSMVGESLDRYPSPSPPLTENSPTPLKPTPPPTPSHLHTTH